MKMSESDMSMWSLKDPRVMARLLPGVLNSNMAPAAEDVALPDQVDDTYSTLLFFVMQTCLQCSPIVPGAWVPRASPRIVWRGCYR